MFTIIRDHADEGSLMGNRKQERISQIPGLKVVSVVEEIEVVVAYEKVFKTVFD